jgi:hypothetical protein
MKKITLAIIAMLTASLSSAQYLTEGFEGNTIPPIGWNVVNTNANQNWQTVTGLSSGITASEGTYAAGILFDVGQQDETLISPIIDLNGAVSPQLRMDISLSYFWAVLPNNNYDITISAVQGVSSTVVWTEADLGVFTGGVWNEIVVDLSAYAGSSITLQINYNGADGDYVLIDDINVEEAPACADPANLSLTGLTPTSADITWTGPTGASYNFEYVTSGDLPGTGTASVLSSPTTSLSGLTPNTNYDVYIESDCGGGLASNVIGPISFRTPRDCSTFVSAPWNLVFGDQTVLDCFGTENVVAGSPGWSPNSANDLDGDGLDDTFMFIFSDATTATKDDYLFGPAVNLVAGNTYTFSFSYNNLVNSATPSGTEVNSVRFLLADSQDITGNLTVLGANPAVTETGAFGDTTGNDLISQATVSTFTYTPMANETLHPTIHVNTPANGELAWFLLFEMGVSSTASIDGEAIDLFTISPNPATDFIQIKNNAPINSIEIINTLGQRVLNNATIVNDRVDIKSLDSGMYFIRASNAQGSKTVRFIKN